MPTNPKSGSETSLGLQFHIFNYSLDAFTLDLLAPTQSFPKIVTFFPKHTSAATFSVFIKDANTLSITRTVKVGIMFDFPLSFIPHMHVHILSEQNQ